MFFFRRAEKGGHTLDIGHGLRTETKALLAGH